MSLGLALVIVVIATVAAAVLAMLETSFTRVGAIDARTLSETDPERAPRLIPLLERPERVLGPTLLLILACHLVAATVWALALDQRYGPGGVAIGVAIEVLVVFFFAEAVPKAVALRESLRVATTLAPIAVLVTRVPVVSQVSFGLLRLARRGGDLDPVISEQELVKWAEAAAEAEVIEAEEGDLIASVFEFGDTIARSVMVPRPDMVTVAADSTVQEALELIVAQGFTRLPVCDDGIDDVIGVTLSKDLLAALLRGEGDHPVTEQLRAANFVPETKRVAELMPEMQARKFHLAVVVDEYGGTAGLVTLEDLIEELVGEIVDEFDQESPLVADDDEGGWVVSARLPVDELEALLGRSDLPEGDWDTAGGLFYNLVGHVPTAGEAVELAGYELRAHAVDGNRIDQLHIRAVADARPQPAAAPVADSDEEEAS